MRLNLYFYILLLTFTLALSTQTTFAQSTVATVGSTAISVDEFMERYELTPQIGGRGVNGREPQARMNFLLTLIGEKLWSQQALEERLDTTEAIQISTEAFEKMFARDLLFRREIREKVKISKKEMEVALDRNATNLYVNFLYGETKQEIDNLYEFLGKGVPFDTIVAARPESKEQIYPFQVIYGQMGDEIEEALFTMKAGAYTKPLESPEGWFIFKLSDKRKNIVKPDETDDFYKSTEKLLKTRKERKLYAEYIANFLSGKKVDVKGPLLKLLAEAVYGIGKSKIEREQLAIDAELFFSGIEINQLLSVLGDNNEKEFITFEGGVPLTLKKVVLMMAFEGFKIYSASPEQVFNQLGGKIQGFIEKELFARHALAKNLHREPEVASAVKMFRENYLFQALRNKVVADIAVTEEEMQALHKKMNDTTVYPVQLNIIEIFVRDAGTMDTVVQSLSSGKPFEEVAKQFNQREWTKAKGGEYGFFPFFMFDEIGEVANKLELYQVSEIIKTDEGYSIIKLIGKKDEVVQAPIRSFEAAKPDYQRQLLAEKSVQRITDYTTELARKFGFTINATTFNGLQPTNVNSLGVRYLGFGGSTLAAPLVQPNSDWYSQYNMYLNINP